MPLALMELLVKFRIDLTSQAFVSFITVYSVSLDTYMLLPCIRIFPLRQSMRVEDI